MIVVTGQSLVVGLGRWIFYRPNNIRHNKRCFIMIVVGRWSLDLVKGPFEAEAGVAHEARAGEIVGELNLGADMQVGATEPLSHVVP